MNKGVSLLCGLAMLSMACTQSESDSSINLTGPVWKPGVVASSSPGKSGSQGQPGTPGQDGQDGEDGQKGGPKACKGHHKGQGNDHKDCGKE